MASEITALAQAFEAEFNKTLTTLPPIASAGPQNHDAHLSHHRLSQRIADSIVYYAGRLPPFASVPRILSMGERLVAMGEHELALQACFKHVRQLNLHASNTRLARMDETACLAAHVQACYGCAASEAALLLRGDPQVKHPDTLKWLTGILQQLRDALSLVLPVEKLYWLALNGTVRVYTISKALITAGFAEQALPTLIFCIKAIEGHVCFAAPKYLPWRCQLYVWAAYGLLDCGAAEQARLLLRDGAAKLAQLVALQKLDPVPPHPEVQAAFRQARAALLALQLRVEVQSAPPALAPPAPATPAGKPPPTPPAGKAAAGAAAVAPEPSIASGPIATLLSELAVNSASPVAQLGALLETLQVPGRRTARHEPVSVPLKEVFDAALKAAAPTMAALKAALAAALESGAAAAPPEGPFPGADQLPAQLHTALLCTAFNFEQWQALDELAELASVRLRVPASLGMPEGDLDALDSDPATAQLAACSRILSALHRLSQAPGVEVLRELATALQRALPSSALASRAAMLPAGHLPPLSSPAPAGAGGAQGAGSAPPGQSPQGLLRDLLTDASLALYGSARPLLDGVYCWDDKEAGTVMDLLAACHATWQVVELDDAVLRACAAIKLGLLMEEVDELSNARAVLLQAKEAVERGRCELMAAARGSPVEHLRWVSAARNQPNTDLQPLTASLTPSEQELACLHVDLLALLARVEMGIGCAEQGTRAAGRRTRLLEEQAQRTAQSAIFGNRSPSQVKMDAQRLAVAANTPPNPPAKERELLAAAGKNPYERAVVLMQMVQFQGSDAQRKAQLLQEAGDLLAKAQAAEAGLFASQQGPEAGRGGGGGSSGSAPSSGGKAAAVGPSPKDLVTPAVPKVLQRGPNTVTLTAWPPNPRAKVAYRKPPVQYTAYCKSYGAGVGLSINKTATEYPGSGIMVPLGQPVAIEGLRTNDTYIFAVAYYDETGALVGTLGASTPEVVIGLPLPLLMLWAHLLTAACRAGAWPAAKRAAGVLLPHFVAVRQDEPLWRSSPMDAQGLNRAHVSMAPRPLLRALAQAIYGYAGGQLGFLTLELPPLPPDTSPAAAAAAAAAAIASPPKQPAPVTPPPGEIVPRNVTHLPSEPMPQLREPYLEQQVARLKACRMVVLAMEVAALLADEGLMQEGALRAYHMLAPLLALKAPRNPYLHKALAAIHAVLSSLTNLVQDSLYRQEHQRALAARVSAAAAYHLLRLSEQVREPGAMATVGRLRVELLKAYDPRFTIAGRPEPPAGQGPPGLHPLAGLQEEASALQDALLLHPKLAEWGPEALAERAKDGADLPARVLPLLAGGTPMAAWATALAFEESAEHPRWVELCVRMLEAGVRSGTAGAELVPIAEQVLWLVKRRLSAPPLEPPSAKWSLEAAAAAVDASKLAPEELALAEGLAGDQLAAAKEEAQARARRRLAAVLMLQQRLPKLLASKQATDKKREALRRWLPWLARLNTLLGLVAAAEGRKWVSGRRAAASQRQGGAALDADGLVRAEDSAPAPVPVPDPEPLKLTPPDGVTPPLQAMIYFSRAAQLASRGSAWDELHNAARHAWNAARALLSEEPTLLAPVPPVRWERGLPPEPESGPESALAPGGPASAASGKDAKKGKAKKDEPKPKTPSSPKARSSARGRKGVVEEAPPPPRTIFLAIGSRPNMARATRSLVNALLDLVQQLRLGVPMHTGVVPLGQGQGLSTRPVRGAPSTGRPQTAVSDSNFSYGSDLQADIWFNQSPLDMAWCSRLLGAALTVLQRGERWHALMDVGRAWMKLSEGAFNEKLLPWMMQAAPKAGADAGPLHAAMESLVRDKNQAIDQLDKVRLLVRERLGDTPLLGLGMGHKARKKKRANAGMAAGRPGARVSASGSAGPEGDTASLVSAAYTYATASTFKTKASQPDFMRLPTEYEKVIELLKKRGEKGYLVLAGHELGDLHAHFGNWGGALGAWKDTLDTLLGPYQAIRHWRPALDKLSPGATLQSYGIHGLLLGSVLASKLARYALHDDLAQRLEACRLGARLVTCCFAAHAGHPQRPLAFAVYTPLELWDGLDARVLWNDPYRCPVQDLAGALETISSMLLECGLALEALPVLALWEHVTLHVMRGLHATVQCRVVRARALISLGLLSEASGVLLGLMAGDHLPDPVMETDYVVREEDGTVLQVPPVPELRNDLLPGDAAHKATLHHLGDAPLPGALEKLYGSYLTAQITLARAQLLMAAGALPCQWKAVNWKTGERLPYARPITPSTGPGAKPGAGAGGAAAAKAAAAAAAAAEAAAAAAAAEMLPEALEGVLLEKANQLLRRALAMARGEDVEPVEPAATGKGAKAAPRSKSPPRAKSPGRSKSPTGKGKGKGEEPPAPQEPSGALVEAPGASSVGQRAVVNVRALLLLCELEQLRWHPARALAHALEASKFIGESADRVNRPAQGDNDDLERSTLGPLYWFQVRLAAVRCAAELGQSEHVHALCEAAAKQAASVNERLLVNAMRHVRAGVLAREGHTAEAIATLAAVAAGYRALHVLDTRLGSALLDHAALRDAIGLRQDCGLLARDALAVLEAYANHMGLAEALLAPELTNLYADGTVLHAAALGAVAIDASRRQQHAACERLTQRALHLLRLHARTVPAAHATAALAAGRAARLAAMCDTGGPDGGSDITSAPPSAAATGTLMSGGGTAAGVVAAAAPPTSAIEVTAAKLGAAKALLCQSIVMACLDGGHLRLVMRDALLELASIFSASLDARSAYVCLKSAHTATAKHTLVHTQSHLLQPVAAAQLPDWAAAYVRGQEAAFNQANGRSPDVPVSDSDLARMVVCHFAALKRGTAGLPAADRPRAEAQVAALHTALKGACAKYGVDACFAEPPLPPTTAGAAAEPPAGSIIVQWHCQDTCWQEPRSWNAEGSLAASLEGAAGEAVISDAQVLGCEPPKAYASLLFVVGASAATARSGEEGAQCGEVAFDVAEVRAMARRVAALRSRMEKPKAATDIYGHSAPTPPELAKLMKDVEKLLSALPRTSEDGSSMDATRPGSRLSTGSGLGRPFSANSALTDSEAEVGAVRPTLDLAFLTKLEAVMTLEGGVEVTDEVLGGWLVQTLPVML